MEITLKELVNLINPKSTQSEFAPNNEYYIIVMDKGFVYAGNVKISGNFVEITNAYNIRYWGTTKGLGELVNGPTEKTKFDKIETKIIAPLSAIIHFIKCNKNW